MPNPAKDRYPESPADNPSALWDEAMIPVNDFGVVSYAASRRTDEEKAGFENWKIHGR